MQKLNKKRFLWLLLVTVFVRCRLWAAVRITWWTPCLSASSTLKSRARRRETPPGGCSSGRRSSRRGTTRRRTASPPTSSTSRSCAASSSANTAAIGYHQLYYFRVFRSGWIKKKKIFLSIFVLFSSINVTLSVKSRLGPQNLIMR